jgi:hypothetical protein
MNLLPIIVATTLAAYATAAQSAPNALFGNTLQINKPDGTIAKFYINEDHSYSATAGDGTPIAGTWSESSGELCFTQSKPAPRIAQCGPLITESVGDVWSMALPNGKSSTLRIIAGRP